MFKETLEKWNASLKEKEDRYNLVKGIHKDLMDIKYIELLLQKSIIKHIEISKTGLIMVVDLDGYCFEMYINEADCEEVPITVICNGCYEEEETNMVSRILQYYKDNEDFVMFDVGANVGWYSLNALKRVPKIKLYAFEPGPITYNRLIKNLELNGFGDNVAYNVGLYNENGKLDFYYDRVRAGASSLVNIQEKADIDKVTVDMIRMDDWAKENHVDKVDFIKCDVEGAELFVYKGGMGLIEKSKPIIFSEMLRKWSAKFGYHPNDIIDLFADVGYECFVIQNDKLKRFGRVDEETVETNYFFLHPERHREIMKKLIL